MLHATQGRTSAETKVRPSGSQIRTPHGGGTGRRRILPSPSPISTGATVRDFWTSQRILLTGATGFLGSTVGATLERRGATKVAAISSTDYDLTDRNTVSAVFAASEPDLVLHLAARVGGIGANQAQPADDLYLDNLLMGTYVIDEARRRGTAKLTVVIGTICSYPSELPLPFHESSLWDGYPEPTNAPYGITKRALLVQLQAKPRAVRAKSGIFVMPTNLYGPGDKFDPAVSHIIPLSSRSVSTQSRATPTTSKSGEPAAQTREFAYVDDAAEGIVWAAECYEGADPVKCRRRRGDLDRGPGGPDHPAHRLYRRGAVGRPSTGRSAPPAGLDGSSPRPSSGSVPRPCWRSGYVARLTGTSLGRAGAPPRGLRNG